MRLPGVHAHAGFHQLAREAGDWKLVKLEVLADQKTLYPDMEETLAAAKVLIAEGFQVMVYCSDDPVYAKKLEDAGCAAIGRAAGELLLRAIDAVSKNPSTLRSSVTYAMPALTAGAGTR